MAGLAEYDELNRLVGNWGKARVEDMKDYIAREDIMHEGDLYDAIRPFIYKTYGKVAVIKFEMPRYGVFVEKGVGKGYPMGMAAMGLGARIPKPWFSQAITDREIDELAGIVGDEYEEINVRLIKNEFREEIIIRR
jgi:hypothetical protein